MASLHPRRLSISRVGVVDTRRMASEDTSGEMKTILSVEALRLSDDMKKVRAEEAVLQEKGGGQLHTITFTLAVDEGAQKTALRSIVAVRAFAGKLLGCDNATEALTGDGKHPALGEGGGESELVLKDISSAQMELALDYIYTGSVAVDKDNCYPLLSTAQKMELPGLTALCSCFLKMPSECSVVSVRVSTCVRA